jgi:hypothetical protein
VLIEQVSRSENTGVAKPKWHYEKVKAQWLKKLVINEYRALTIDVVPLQLFTLKRVIEIVKNTFRLNFNHSNHLNQVN